MATNKNALLRYKILDNCFRNTGKRYFISDLIFEIEKVLNEIDPESNGISRRQIFDDINFMESKEGWNIELDKRRDGKKVFYRYTDLTFSINNMPLNEIEIHYLKDAINILSQFKGMPQFEWVNKLLHKLHPGILLTNELYHIIEFDSNKYLKGIEHLGILYNSIYYKKVLLIGYQPFENDNPDNVIIHPYFLKQFNNRWFLFGLNPQSGKHDWNLALDRIVTIQETTSAYVINNEINWRDYFEDIIGVTKVSGAVSEKVILIFKGITGNYIESKPLHGSQKSKWLDAKTLQITLDIIINYELEQFILSYADCVTIEYPIKLKTKINERLNKALLK